MKESPPEFISLGNPEPFDALGGCDDDRSAGPTEDVVAVLLAATTQWRIFSAFYLYGKTLSALIHVYQYGLPAHIRPAVHTGRRG